ncbi:MAG TPA: short-chain dehydrogenase, partial [Halieaceae bacterium]|nr:short-chain dehydrogenase [Halieaceae bacterium]
VLGVNVRGIAHGVQAFVPRMLASGEEGVVMNTSSGDGGISPLA